MRTEVNASVRTLISIPLAEQLRRRSRSAGLVQLQHGIPAFARSGARAKAAAPKFLSFGNEGGLVRHSRCELRLGKPSFRA